VTANGSYREAVRGRDQRGGIAIWTEWEAASECAALAYAGPAPPGAPRFHHRPLFPQREQRPVGIPQNTDPFVFGERFLYTFCAQSRTSAKRLHHLARGSVIVFGSVDDGRFVLDTVFVVAGARQHRVENWEATTRGIVPRAFTLTTLEPMYAWPGSRRRTFTLYLGATSPDPVDGMYSFVPCAPSRGEVRGFSRPSLDGIPGITPTNARAVKFNRDLRESCVGHLWGRVAERVLECGLVLGTHVDLPPLAPADIELSSTSSP
jgi:hypothetical protein